MRIEYEGVIEQGPTYQHVGYLAAANTRVVGHEVHLPQTLGFATLGLTILLITARASRRLGFARTLIGAAIGVVFIGLALAWGMSSTPIVEKYYNDPNEQTRLRIHSHEQRVERYIDEHGQLPATLPPRDDVTAPGTIEDENLDAWAREFRYEVFEEPDEDGNLFRVVSAGADGVFGTEDDIHRGITHDETRIMDQMHRQTNAR